MTYIVTQTLNGFFSAALLFLIASGLTLAIGVMRIVNIAHGSFYMLGAYKGTIVHASDPTALWRNEEIKTQFLGIPRTAR